MDEHVRECLRPACPGCLTACTGDGALPGRTGHPSLIPGPEPQQDKPHSKVSGGNVMPGNRIKIIMA